MSDTNQGQYKQKFLMVLVLLLVLFAGIQTWYMLGMKKQLDLIHTRQSSTQLQEQDSTAIEKNIAETDNAAEPADSQQSYLQEKEVEKLAEKPGENVTPDNAAEPVDSQQSSLQEKEVEALVQKPPAEKPGENVTPDNAAESVDSQQSSLQEKEVEALVQKPAEKPGENIKPDKTPALSYDDTFSAPFESRTRNPHDEIQRMQHEMDRRFNQRFNRQRFNRLNNKPDFQYHFSQSLSTPKIDVRENENQYTVIMNLPGADESGISVNLDGQRLTIKVKQDYKKQSRDATGNMMFRERRSGKFQRSIILANPVIQNKMKQHLDNGVLVIIIPKVKY